MDSTLPPSCTAAAPSKYHEALTDSDYDGDCEPELNQANYGLESIVLIEPIASHASDFYNTPTGSITSFNSSEYEEDLVLVGSPSSGGEMRSEDIESEEILFEFPTMRFPNMGFESGADYNGRETLEETSESKVEMTSTKTKPANSMMLTREGAPIASTLDLPDRSEVLEGSSPIPVPTTFSQQIPTASPVEIALAAASTEDYALLQPQALSEEEKEAINPHIQALTDLLAMDNKETIASVLQTLRKYIEAHPYLTALQVASMLLTLFPATAFPALFWALGFGRTGPIAGTLATTWQASLVGGASAGGYFSAFQSVAMGGVKGLMMVQNVVRGGAVVTAVGTALGNAVGWKTGTDQAEKSPGMVNKEVGEKCEGSG